MKRWNPHTRKEVDNEKIDAFMVELFELCKKHDLNISHEDTQGAFEIHAGFDAQDFEWINQAFDCT